VFQRSYWKIPVYFLKIFEEFKMTLKEKVFQLIADSGKSDYALTKEIGLKSTAIADWRRKDNAKPSADAIAKIAKYFNVSADYLLGLTENSSPYHR